MGSFYELLKKRRMVRHYTGEPYSQRDRGRVSAWIEVETWHSWAVNQPCNGEKDAASTS